MSWRGLQNKDQLVVLALCRFAEPLANTSILSYLYYLLRSFDPDASPSVLSARAGYVAVSFALGQFCSGAFWGKTSDRIGRKPVIMIGTAGTVVASVALALSSKLVHVVLARFIAGLLNGNVGVMRTMVSEIVPKGPNRGRAFLILPMCFNIGSIVGPILGGFLSEPNSPNSSLRWLVSTLGLTNFFERYPFALPNLASAAILLNSWLLAWALLRETLTHPAGGYELVAEGESHRSRTRLLTPLVRWTLFAFALLPLHVSSHMQLLPIFLSLPVGQSSGLLSFTGGLGFTASQVGMVISVAGGIGIILQLFVFPRVQDKVGTMGCYRWGMPVFVIAYVVTPFLSRLGHRGTLAWALIFPLTFLAVLARTFVGPCSVVLLNDSCEDPTQLGAVNGLGQSLSSLSRVIGPLSASTLLAWGQNHGCVGIAFWFLAIEASLGFITAGKLKSMS
ncbi:hypothetical protein PYCC9005_005357 [Savitreella phatthalungensis]